MSIPLTAHHAPSSRLKLYFRCENLIDADIASKSDPYIVLSQIPHSAAVSISGAVINNNSLRRHGGSMASVSRDSLYQPSAAQSTRSSMVSNAPAPTHYLRGDGSVGHFGSDADAALAQQQRLRGSSVHDQFALDHFREQVQARRGQHSRSVVGDRHIVLGRTETVMNNLNPKFTTGFEVDYFFEQRQDFEIAVFDDDGKNTDNRNDYLGRVTFQLAHVICAPQGGLCLQLAPKGKVFVTASEISNSSRDTVQIKWTGENIHHIKTTKLSDGPSTFYTISRILPNGKKVQLYKSATVKAQIHPNWRASSVLKVSDLCPGSTEMHQRTIHVECFHEGMVWNSLIGECLLTPAEFLCPCTVTDANYHPHDMGHPSSGSAGPMIPLIRTANKTSATKKNKSYGILRIDTTLSTIIKAPTLMDFLRGGMQVNLSVAIDFTASNGDPKDARSLHYMNPMEPNDYVRALMSVGDILLEYDTDKKISAYGFGACTGRNSVSRYDTSHCFNLCDLSEGFSISSAQCENGIQGVIDAYGRALSTVRLSGPTNFAPMIRHVHSEARKAANTYSILLILTDGEITDMNETLTELVKVSNGTAPLAVIIVGVGRSCSFTAMHILDGDNDRLRCPRTGAVARRDIVQFVPFRNYESAPPGALAAEVLREIPDQVAEWAALTNTRPAPPVPSPHKTAPAGLSTPRSGSRPNSCVASQAARSRGSSFACAVAACAQDDLL